MIVGLTGGVASGKSTVSQLFETLGVPVIDADKTAHSLVNPGSPGLDTVIDTFGRKYLLDDGQLDRKRLGELVFSDPEKRRTLEQLLHPLIKEAMLAEAEHLTAPYILFVIPLLCETAQYDMVDRILLVDCSEEMQLSRLIARDGITRQHAQAIIDSQASRRQRQQIANDLIHNETRTDQKQLPAKIQALHERYLRLAAQKKQHAALHPR